MKFDLLNAKSGEKELDFSFCITGKFELPRPKIVKILENMGAVWDENPTKTTNFLIVGE
jgi:NAD-dependent DNA ligase